MFEFTPMFLFGGESKKDEPKPKPKYVNKFEYNSWVYVRVENLFLFQMTKVTELRKGLVKKTLKSEEQGKDVMLWEGFYGVWFPGDNEITKVKPCDVIVEAPKYEVGDIVWYYLNEKYHQAIIEFVDVKLAGGFSVTYTIQGMSGPFAEQVLFETMVEAAMFQHESKKKD